MSMWIVPGKAADLVLLAADHDRQVAVTRLLRRAVAWCVDEVDPALGHFLRNFGGLEGIGLPEIENDAAFWESLNQKNSWGGNWASFKDVPHFERRT